MPLLNKKECRRGEGTPWCNSLVTQILDVMGRQDSKNGDHVRNPDWRHVSPEVHFSPADTCLQTLLVGSTSVMLGTACQHHRPGPKTRPACFAIQGSMCDTRTRTATCTKNIVTTLHTSLQHYSSKPSFTTLQHGPTLAVDRVCSGRRQQTDTQTISPTS